MTWFPFFRRRRKNSGNSSLMDREAFLDIVKKECLRCNRTNSRFCLIKLELREEVEVPRQLASLEKVLRSRLRITDEVGQLNPTDVGIVLPDTSVEGAIKVIDDIIKLIPLSVHPPIHTIYFYPSEQISDPAIPNEIESHSAQAAVIKPLELLL